MNGNKKADIYRPSKGLQSKSSKKKRLYKYRFLYLLAFPAFAYLIINNYMPMVGLMLAFKNYSFAKGIFGSEWNGIKNFTYLFGSKWAGIMFKNTPPQQPQYRFPQSLLQIYSDVLSDL